MNKCPYRPGLPEPPPKIAALDVHPRGYPIPYFLLNKGAETDFRVTDPQHMAKCITGHLCWVCGEKLYQEVCFVGGPLLAVNHCSAEPPSHHDCATYSATACPFLTKPRAIYQDATPMPEGYSRSSELIKNNSGIAVCFYTRSFAVERVRSSFFWRLGRASRSVGWYSEGKPATREQVETATLAQIDAAQEQTGYTMPEEWGEAARRLWPK